MFDGKTFRTSASLHSKLWAKTKDTYFENILRVICVWLIGAILGGELSAH